MPPSVAIRKFKGLQTSTSDMEGDFADLKQALNVQFERDGTIEARLGFQHRQVMPAGVNTTAYVGRRHHTATGELSWCLFQAAGAYYKWDGSTTIGASMTVQAGVPNGPGIAEGCQYGNLLYLLNGDNWDGVTIAVTGGGFPSTSAGSLCTHAERIWLAKQSTVNPCRVYFSDAGNPASWPAANFIDVSPGDGGYVVHVRSFRNRLYIFKSDSLWILETPGVPTSWSLRRFSYDGCLDSSPVEYEGELYWVSRLGVYRHAGNSTQLISEPIRDIFETNIDVNSSSKSTVYKDNLIFHIAIEGVERLFCYNVYTKAWTEWNYPILNSTGVSLKSLFSINSYSGSFRPGICIGLSTFFMTGRLVQTDEDITIAHQDVLADGTATEANFTYTDYNSVIQTKYADFGEPTNKKRVNMWAVESVGGNMTVTQTDEENRSVSQFVMNNDVSTIIKESHFNKIRGIGYFRRLSMTITSNDIKGNGFKIRGLFGEIKTRGGQIAKETQSIT